MTEPTQGSQKDANRGSLDGALREIMGKFLAGVDDMLPAVVISYDRTENRVEVRPVVKLLKTDGTVVERASIASVPVLNIGGGNAVLSFPLKPGDLGWIKANDRDISLFMQSMADAQPNTLRKHNFADALFIPDAFKNWTLNPADENSTVLQTLDGSQRVILDDNLVRIVSDNQVHITAASALVLTAPISFNVGTALFSGSIAAAGSISSNVDIVADVDGTPVSVLGHVHPQGNDSGGNVEVPTGVGQ